MCVFLEPLRSHSMKSGSHHGAVVPVPESSSLPS